MSIDFEANYLGEIIAALEPVAREYPDARVARGFDPGSAHSWRGSYSELSFEPETDVSLAAMVNALKAAHGGTFQGYKGGEYTMHAWVEVYLDPRGTSAGDRIGSTLVSYWIEEARQNGR